MNVNFKMECLMALAYNVVKIMIFITVILKMENVMEWVVLNVKMVIDTKENGVMTCCMVMEISQEKLVKFTKVNFRKIK